MIDNGLKSILKEISYFHAPVFSQEFYENNHGLRTPNEGRNQRNLKMWADVADKICFGRT